MMPIRFLQPAEQEMLNALQYYELQIPGLGAAFLDKIDSATTDISEHPDRWSIVRLNIRRRLIHRFPYGLLYRIDSNEVVVLAVAHLHRHPSYWIRRTPSHEP